jgi:hypothetical protein
VMMVVVVVVVTIMKGLLSATWADRTCLMQLPAFGLLSELQTCCQSCNQSQTEAAWQPLRAPLTHTPVSASPQVSIMEPAILKSKELCGAF